jgi:hypothetical protein
MSLGAPYFYSLSCWSLLSMAACSSPASDTSPVPGTSAGATSSAGGSSSGGANGAAGGNTAQAGTANGTSGSTSIAGTGGGVGSSGSGGGTSAGAGSSETDPPAPRPLMVNPATSCKCDIKFSAVSVDPDAGKSTTDTHATDDQVMFVDTSKTIQGKLVICIGGIGGGPGGGGIEGFAKNAGFHVFLVATQTAISGAPQQYKTTLATNPMDPEANRQVGDGRMEAWDGKDRVDWLDIQPPDSIVNRTEHALEHAMTADPGGDWGYYLNADGTVRWTDVYMVGYSFGSQTIAMDSKYVRFGRVVATSGPQDEGFPNATWISQPSATPVDRLYMAVGFTQPYPSTAANDNEVMGMLVTVKDAGWPSTIAPVNVVPEGMGPFMGTHELAMVGSDQHSPGGHTVFCNNDTMSGWLAPCKYLFGVQ